MPFIPIFIGVIVLGLVIGAGLSMFAKRNDSPVAVRVSSPQPSLAPVTPAPTEKPVAEATLAAAKPEDTDTATPLPTERPSRKPTHATVAPAARATAAPAAISATKAATAGPAVAASRSIPSEQPVLRHAVPAGSVAAAAAPTDAPASADDADSEFAKLAAGVVRQYLAAVARGDIPGAYGALGQSVPDNDATLPESGVVDGNTRIRHVEARGSDESAAVNVDMQGRSGVFFGQFTVHKTPSGAAIIVQHTVMKP